MARVLAHAHTTWSHDGTLSLAQWVELAQSRGCEAVLFSEHEESGWTPNRYQSYVADCQAATTAEVQLIPGLEFRQDGYHLLCYGLEHLPKRPSPPRELAAAVHAQGRVLCLAHPAKYEWRFPHSLLAAADAVEVWNSKWIYDGTLGPHPKSLALAPAKLPWVGQDVHKTKHLSPLYFSTASPDILEDLAHGRFQVVLGRRRWTPEQLRRRSMRALLQRLRAPAMRAALTAYRSARRLRLGSGSTAVAIGNERLRLHGISEGGEPTSE
jgi:hypothetical protein